MKTRDFPSDFPEQKQSQQPGMESDMTPAPITDKGEPPIGRLSRKVALITGGDSGIGRAIAVAFAKEGAKIAFAYLNEHGDAQETSELVKDYEAECICFAGDISSEEFCKELVWKTVEEYGGLDILINNAAEQHPCESLEDITEEQLERTFRTNLFSQFFLTKAALPHLREGASVINTASVTAYRGSPALLDYSATKGAIIAFTRSLSQNLASKKIRVNAVAPGPIWTPLIPSTFDEKSVAEFGKDTPLGRAGQPSEVAPCYVFLASDESSYMTGQVLHPNGGEIVNG
ncbi:MAG: NAD(P)-dependent oxidoreductase [Armatimonadetes bacterium 55-13]|nr:SDR family oxidoreductase [Armatimonadota bacterium]ODU54026.1 MAG: NAD(P)-dependent oxidoreductase [bacterium SCN 57-13]OJU62145.1 MAG: NAD(P)-dependent oxidoreductase [Armatimonadetes bacterium 55-13]